MKKLKTIQKINWFLLRFTGVSVIIVMLGISHLDTKPIQYQSVISAILLLVTGITTVIEQMIWQNQKNPRLRR